MNQYEIVELDADAGRREVAALCDVLIDCVEGGASVGFVLPMTQTKALDFWDGVFESIEREETVLLGAIGPHGLVGTVQLQKAMKENQPHRADVSKLLVHRRARRNGLGEQLMRAVEAVALREARRVLVLDTATPEAERIYERLGWQHCGAVPDYALMPDGSLCATTYYWKHVAT